MKQKGEIKMDAILELLLTVVVETANAIHFKNPKTRTWVMTVIISVCICIFAGVPVCGAVELSRQGSTVGTIVMSVIALAFIAVGLLLVARGHKNRWEKY